MRRYTLISIGLPRNVKSPVKNEYVADSIKKEEFFQHEAIDFSTRDAVLEAQSNWYAGPRNLMVVLEYETSADNEATIFSFSPNVYASDLGISTYYFNEPLILQVQEGRHRGLTQVHHTETLNPNQSTHTTSVHESVRASLENLKAHYTEIDIAKNICAIKKFAKEITSHNFPEIPALKLQAAQHFIQNMEAIFHEKEMITQLTIDCILALVWEGMHVNPSRITVAKEAFIKNLYESQRGYNLDKKNRDDGGKDKPICISGIINKLVDTLNGLHPLVNIIYVTQETASLKLMSLVREHTLNFIKLAPNPAKLFEEIKKLQVSTGMTVQWGIPPSILKAIAGAVMEEFYKEFEQILPKQLCEEIFAQFDYISLDKKTFNRLAEAPNTQHEVVHGKRTSIEEACTQMLMLVEQKLHALFKASAVSQSILGDIESTRILNTLYKELLNAAKLYFFQDITFAAFKQLSGNAIQDARVLLQTNSAWEDFFTTLPSIMEEVKNCSIKPVAPKNPGSIFNFFNEKSFHQATEIEREKDSHSPREMPSFG
ncbi:hypothetical protein [Legionella septentrionalis]|uniref:hypothetical protein n=1 Tax=Legionella septentrionalis TaxID=2498109 RepID=UPI000F8E2FB6|nr:hypothetical protein [Legionella septentrionalis]RUQ95758.1 hypothetical protein ELY11_08765 [Legionella septentrionalis]